MNFKNTVVAAVLVTMAGTAIGASAASRDPDEPVLPLSKTQRKALRAEMREMMESVAEMGPALAMGEWDTAARRALLIRDSHMLKQKFTPEQMTEFGRALPKDFEARNASFHQHADLLAQAANQQNRELAVFHFSRMIEGCGDCHTRYATHVLEGFRPPTPAPGK